MTKIFLIICLGCSVIVCAQKNDSLVTKRYIEPKLGVGVTLGVSYDIKGNHKEIFAMPLAAGLLMYDRVYAELGCVLPSESMYMFFQYRFDEKKYLQPMVYGSVNYNIETNTFSLSTGLQCYYIKSEVLFSLGITTPTRQWAPSLSFTIGKFWVVK